MCGPHQVWPLRSECCGRGVPTKVVCAECMKMCCLGGKNSVVKGLMHSNDHIIGQERGEEHPLPPFARNLNELSSYKYQYFLIALRVLTA